LSISLLVSAAFLAASATVTPVQRVDVGNGRHMVLRCLGNGPRTVLFDSGGSDWSPVWALVQPEVAKVARACTYDRAGLGESDPARGPRTPGAIAQDIHALVSAAKISGPVVLVGHSLGGFNVKLAAALYPDDVAGLVLLDPAEDRTWDRSRDKLAAKYGSQVAARAELADQAFIGMLIEHYRRCSSAAANGPLDLEKPEWRRCGDPDRPALSPELNAERRRIHATANYQAAQASEIAWSVYGDHSADGVYEGLFKPGRFGSRPTVVLTHQEEPSNDPVDQLNTEQGLTLHRETAALSQRGSHSVVPDSGHYIQLDQPKIVSEAILDVLRKLDSD